MFLGYVGPATHSELTAVGNPLTMLYRLEDLAEPNEVLLPADLYDEMSTKDASPQSAPRLPGSTWQPVRESVPLRGVGNVQIVRCRVAV
jgi:class 3 adenylate cyclase